MSNSNKFKASAQATRMAYAIANPPSHQRTQKMADGKKRNKSTRELAISMETIKNIASDFGSPFEIASEGNLELLKSYCENYSGMLKELDECQASILHHAARSNQIAVMQYVIESGIDLNAKDKDGNTALHVATLQHHAQAVSLLLSNGINDVILNNNLYAGLHIACRLNDTTVVAAYLEHTHINIVITGYRKRTPLHVIAEHDNLEACEVFNNSVLVQDIFKNKTGFRICATDEDDLTPIHLAARKGSHRVLDYIMTNCKSHGYPTEVVLSFLDEEDSTPLHAAIDGGYLKVVEVLLKHGACPVVAKKSQLPPFLLACTQGRLDMIEAIINYGQDCSSALNCRDIYGQTCLHRCTQAINSHQVIAYLTNKGAEINAVDNKGQTPLMISIIAGSAQGVSALLEREADLTIKDREGNNAMHHAVLRKRKKILGLLLQTRQSKQLVVCSDNKGQSPIHLALSMGLSDMVHAMMAVIRKDLKNIKDSNGNNYLHLAAKGGDWKAITILLDIPECLMLLNELNKYGGTPLHFASFGGHTKCVELLLSHGAMVHKCHYGITPFMSACYHGHHDVARLLFDAHPFQLKWTSDTGSNALHMAANSGCPTVVSFCLDIGVPMILNNDHESFLDIIISKNYSKAAAAVVNHQRYQEALDLVSPHNKHPMIKLIVNMPDIAKQVLDRSLTKSDQHHLSPDYWEKFDFKYLQLSKGTNDGRGSEPDREEKPTPMDEKDMMDMHTIRYKGSVKRNVPANENNEISHLETLKTMVKYNRGLLLTHPVTDCFIKSKWRTYGRWIHILLLSFVLLQVLFLLGFSASIPNPTDIILAFKQTNASVSCGDGTNGTVVCPQISFGSNVCRFIALGFAGLNFIIWLIVVIKIRQEALNLVNNAFVLIDILAIAFTIFFLIPTRGLDNAYWRAGAVATFFSWFSLLLRIQLFDLFGVYITMFLTTTRTVFQVLSISFLFLMGFSVSFYILAGNLKDYSSIGNSLFINFGHLLGEIDYTAFVAEDVEGNLPHDWLTFMFVIILAILMGIVVMNLLIGLAVGDIEQIRNEAITGKKLVEVTFFSQIDSLIPSRVLSKIDKEAYMKYPNQKVGIYRAFWRILWRYVKGKNPNLDTTEDSSQNFHLESRNKEIVLLKGKVDELTLQQEKIMATLMMVREAQESMLKMMAKNEEDEEDLCEL